MALQESDLPTAWRLVGSEDAARLESRLRREMRPGHLLDGQEVQAVARCLARDDVLFHLGGHNLYAVIHLTYSDASGGAYVQAILGLSDLRWYLLTLDPND